MNFIFDHLAASILGIAVFFVLVAVQVRGNETARDQTSYFSAKTHQLGMRKMIEHDFENIGAGVARYDPIFITKSDSVFEFMAKLTASATSASKITYRRVPTEIVEVVEGNDTTSVQLYEVRRLVDDVLTGKTPEMVKDFSIELHDGNDQVTADFDAVESVHVRFSVMSPIGDMDGLHEARWARSFRPSNLSNF